MTERDVIICPGAIALLRDQMQRYLVRSNGARYPIRELVLGNTKEAALRIAKRGLPR